MEPMLLADAPTVPRPPDPTPAILLPMPALPARPTLAALFEAEESGLLRFALALVRRRAIAEELVQETFLRLHQVWTEVENPRAWLYRSLRNLALNHLRDHPAEAELQEEIAPPHDAARPDEAFERDEAIGMMRLHLAELPADDRALVELKYRDNLRYQEISRRTGLSVGNVGYRLHHALKTLAERLRHAGIDAAPDRRALR
jgi:RNA polymerase sigma-70 factor (ECF subfamily)